MMNLCPLLTYLLSFRDFRAEFREIQKAEAHTVLSERVMQLNVPWDKRCEVLSTSDQGGVQWSCCDLV